MTDHPTISPIQLIAIQELTTLTRMPPLLLIVYLVHQVNTVKEQLLTLWVVLVLLDTFALQIQKWIHHLLILNMGLYLISVFVP